MFGVWRLLFVGACFCDVNRVLMCCLLFVVVLLFGVSCYLLGICCSLCGLYCLLSVVSYLMFCLCCLLCLLFVDVRCLLLVDDCVSLLVSWFLFVGLLVSWFLFVVCCLLFHFL